MIAKGDTYPTAMLIVFKLDGDFDVDEAIKHANVDAEMSQNFQQLNASTDDFNGFPSSMIEGSYDLNGAPDAQLQPHRHRHRRRRRPASAT